MSKVYREIHIDQLTPVAAYKALAQKGSCLLESPFDPSQKKQHFAEARYSYIGIESASTFSAIGRSVEVHSGGQIQRSERDPFEALKDFHAEQKEPIDHPLALFSGGIVGCVAYDAARMIEKIGDRHPRTSPLPDLFFSSYRTSLIFDHKKGKGLFVADTEREIEEMLEKLRASPLPILEQRGEVQVVQLDIGDAEYAAMVEEAKQSIRAGDLFQIVLSRTFEADLATDPFSFYRALRQTSPAPYLFYFDLGDVQIAGASPEKIISIVEGQIESMPIAGTSRIGEPLLSDPKESAEHAMLVDLARNDVGSVAVAGSVQVVEYKKLEHFSHLQHIVSRVQGKLKREIHPIDAFKASFPAGTLTGAPKVKAMGRIDALEKNRRGLYGGAIVALDDKGNLTSCIAIRTALIEKGHVTMRAGAGIVLDSDPLKEAEETRLKASGLIAALTLGARL